MSNHFMFGYPFGVPGVPMQAASQLQTPSTPGSSQVTVTNNLYDPRMICPPLFCNPRRSSGGEQALQCNPYSLQTNIVQNLDSYMYSFIPVGLTDSHPLRPPTNMNIPFNCDMSAVGFPFHTNYGSNDMSTTRRKNATRETTAALKTWLNDHKKNPYPTKSEKMMLAIVTRMTLTQVSTWFANARRRLKKENKMTWIPKNKQGEEDDDIDDEDAEEDVEIDSDCDLTDKSANGISTVKMENPGGSCELRRTTEKINEETTSLTNESEFVQRGCCNVTNETQKNQEMRIKRERHQSSDDEYGKEMADEPPEQKIKKPKIWSIADVATSNDKKNDSNVSHSFDRIHSQFDANVAFSWPFMKHCHQISNIGNTSFNENICNVNTQATWFRVFADHYASIMNKTHPYLDPSNSEYPWLVINTSQNAEEPQVSALKENE